MYHKLQWMGRQWNQLSANYDNNNNITAITEGSAIKTFIYVEISDRNQDVYFDLTPPSPTMQLREANSRRGM